MNVFYIDDDEDEIDLFVEAVSIIDQSIKCSFETSGQKALAMLRNIARPDVIFLDYNMPKLNGFDCLVMLKNDPTFEKVPVVIYTTIVEPHQARSLYQAGAFKIVEKDNSFRRACEKLREVLFETGLRASQN